MNQNSKLKILSEKLNSKNEITRFLTRILSQYLLCSKFQTVTLDARRNDRQNLNDEEDLTSFLQNNETIIRKGFVVKRRGLFPRRRLLILTNSPRLIYIDPSTNIQKGEIQFDNITKAEPQDFKTFYVHTVS